MTTLDASYHIAKLFYPHTVSVVVKDIKNKPRMKILALMIVLTKITKITL